MNIKCTFTKDREGQRHFERSLTLGELKLLLIVCDDIQVKYRKKNKCEIMFIFKRHRMNTYVKTVRVKDYIAKQFLSMEEWMEG